jgi:hypothetical protein
MLFSLEARDSCVLMERVRAFSKSPRLLTQRLYLVRLTERAHGSASCCGVKRIADVFLVEGQEARAILARRTAGCLVRFKGTKYCKYVSVFWPTWLRALKRVL